MFSGYMLCARKILLLKQNQPKIQLIQTFEAELDKISNAIYRALATASKADRGVANKLVEDVM